MVIGLIAVLPCEALSREVGRAVELERGSRDSRQISAYAEAGTISLPRPRSTVIGTAARRGDAALHEAYDRARWMGLTLRNGWVRRMGSLEFFGRFLSR